jgi:glucose/arabinose dehydrogenase
MTLLMLVALAVGCGGGGSHGHENPPPGGSFTATPVFEGVNFPSALRFAPDGRLFFTELNTGQVRVAQGTQILAAPFATLPVATNGEQGALGLALDPQFGTNGFVYVCYTDVNQNCNRMVRFTDSGNVGGAMTVIVDDLPINTNHNGGRIGFGPDGKLYITIGDNQNPGNSQNPSVLPGKLLRFNPDGSIPADNPVPGSPMYALGLRNPFGLAFQPGTGSPFLSENGPGCDDELNRITAGGNYGWRPDQPCNDQEPGFTLPLARFNPTIAPTGTTFSTSDNYGFNGSLLMTSFNDGALRLFTLSGGAVASQQTLLTGIDGGLLDVTQAPDGSIYFCGTDTIYRLTMTD